jgi:hypothetical protein
MDDRRVLLMGFPISPDGLYHYHVGYQVTGQFNGIQTIGFTFVATEGPILVRSNAAIDDLRANVAKSMRGVSASQIIITSLSVLAAPE